MASSSSLSLSFPSSSLSRTWDYDVFPSFHGEDVRKAFLSQILKKEFGRKAINFFVDHEMERGEFIGPVLKQAIKGSKIALVLLSKNYASSWCCLDELVEIMKKESGQTVITIFYEVDPNEVKKQTGDFGKAFKETCQGKTEEKVQTWRKALEGVGLATIAGFHSSNWVDETDMIENIAAYISSRFQNSAVIEDIKGSYPKPRFDEDLQIFCKYAFNQKTPEDGFDELAREITYHVGELPLGLKVIGSHFRGLSKEQWPMEVSRLRTYRNGDIERILKFSYDALCDEDKDLFLHIACLFNNEEIVKVEDYLALDFLDARHGLHLLAEKSLIDLEGVNYKVLKMHNLLEQLGKEIVRYHPAHHSIREPEKRQFLVDTKDICEVLADGTGSKSIKGICFDLDNLSGRLNISERAFEGMTNLKFLRVLRDRSEKLYLPQGLNYLPKKLRLIEWDYFPMKSLPSNFCTTYLVNLHMRKSKLEKLWEGKQPLGNLKWMNLSNSRNLKELPDLSTATKLQDLNLTRCSSLVEIPFSIGNTTNLEKLNLVMCTSLVELPSSIGSLHKLRELRLRGCSKLEVLPTNISLESLDNLDITDCSLLKSFPDISTNIKHLSLARTAINEVPSRIKSWSRLRYFVVSYNENLKESPHALDTITMLSSNDTKMQELPRWVKKISRLETLMLEGCKNLVTLPELPDSLSNIGVINCESLERLDCSFYKHPNMFIGFVNCLKLNKEARELIQTSSSTCSILPGRRVPSNFTYRKTGGSVLVNLNQSPLSTTLVFKACVLLVNKDDKKKEANGTSFQVYYRIMDKRKLGVIVPWRSAHGFVVPPILAEHLLTFELEADVKTNEFFFEFEVNRYEVVIKECGVLQL